jgi:hypothetical protein
MFKKVFNLMSSGKNTYTDYNKDIFYLTSRITGSPDYTAVVHPFSQC